MLLQVILPLKHVLLTLSASTTSSKHVLHEELELVWRPLTRRGRRSLLTRSMARARSRRRRRARARVSARVRARARSTTSSLLQGILGLQGHLVGDFQHGVRSIRWEFEAKYLLNDMHNVGSIWKVLHYILTGLEDLVPYVVANGELSELITKAIKHNRGVILKKSGVTNLRIQGLAKNVVEDIEVRLQPNR